MIHSDKNILKLTKSTTNKKKIFSIFFLINHKEIL